MPIKFRGIYFSVTVLFEIYVHNTNRVYSTLFIRGFTIYNRHICDHVSLFVNFYMNIRGIYMKILFNLIFWGNIFYVLHTFNHSIFVDSIFACTSVNKEHLLNATIVDFYLHILHIYRS